MAKSCHCYDGYSGIECDTSGGGYESGWLLDLEILRHFGI
jgi:hypothetical protein